MVVWATVHNIKEWVGLFLLTGKSFLLTVGLCCLRSIGLVFFCLRLKFGLVFFAYGGKSVWSFLLTVPPGPEIRFGLFCLRFPPSGNWVWSFLLTVPPP